MLDPDDADNQFYRPDILIINRTIKPSGWLSGLHVQKKYLMEKKSLENFDLIIQLVEANRKATRVLCYAFSVALAGVVAVITVAVNSEAKILFSYIGCVVLMLIFGHFVFKKRIDPKFIEVIEAVREKSDRDRTPHR